MNVPIGCTTQNCVAEIRMDDHGNPFGELTPFVHFFGEVPKSGTKLYIGTPAASDELRGEELSDDELGKIYSDAFYAENLASIADDGSIAGGIKKAGLQAMRAIIAADRARRSA